MEKMMGGMMFDKKFIEQRKIFLWGAVDDKSAKDITNKTSPFLLFTTSTKNNIEIKCCIKTLTIGRGEKSNAYILCFLILPLQTIQ